MSTPIIEQNPIPNYVAGKEFKSGIPSYLCMRQGFHSCMHLTTMEEKCYQKDDKIIRNTNYFCTDIMPDNLYRYSMLGGGASNGNICPNSEFKHSLDNIGDKKKITFPGG